MSLLEQSLTKNRSETNLILDTNLAITCEHYDTEFGGLGDIKLIWQDTTKVGVLEDQDVPNVLENNEFYADSIWTKGAGWSISNNKAELDGSQTSDSILKQSLVINKFYLYKVKIVWERNAGALYLLFDGSIPTNDIYLIHPEVTIVVRALSDGDFCLKGTSNAEAIINEVYCHQIDPQSINKFDAIAYSSHNQSFNIGEYIVSNSITYVIYKIESHLDYKKLFFLRL